jgi:two-component system, chemotaxis family, protein-glutamate methylesterase/glutaminase
MENIQGKYKAVVIGTSAGGLNALSVLLDHLPANYSIPLMVVQHRAKDQRDLLEEVLQAKCSIKIKQADEKEPISAGIVYIAPPDYHLLVEADHTLSLSDDAPVCFSRPSIDVLFETAAVVFKKTLAGIILTGANSDGADGIVAISKCGGLTIAQDPAEADFPFMPAAAIDTRYVQHTWKLEAIRDFLLSINER